jgi:dihydropteroate synthase
MPSPTPLTLGPVHLDFARPALMGILNVTPDSFSDGGSLPSLEAVLARARKQVEDGAVILDVGGESTRPGSQSVSVDEELARVVPAVRALAAAGLGVALSVDTSKAEVAAAALAAGAHLVNDVTALADPAMAGVVARAGAALVVMHMRGEPRTMQTGDIVYTNLVGEVRETLERALVLAAAAGIPRERVLVDPGLGFGKTTLHNLTLTRRLQELATLGCAIVYGSSRKRFLGEVTGRPVSDRDRATAATCVAAVLAGAHVLRVHDVGAVRDAVLVATALRDAP